MMYRCPVYSGSVNISVVVVVLLSGFVSVLAVVVEDGVALVW